MKSHVLKLQQSANKHTRLIIGLMSGTSLDGLDVALCKITGAGVNTQAEVVHFKTCDYSDQVKAKIQRVFAKKTVDLEYLTLLNPWLGQFHGQLINQCLQQWQVDPSSIDFIASHGQTIYHCPRHQHNHSEFSNATLQIADADHIATTTGVITLGDFRQKHIAAGGEGAPLALYGDYYLFKSQAKARVLVNIGGIANLTYMPKNAEFDELVCTDIGPGNTLLDAYTRQYFAQSFDKNATLARQGKINTQLLNALQETPFFKQPMPKTTGPEVFNLTLLTDAKKVSHTEHISHEDTLATLCALTANTLSKSIKAVTNNQEAELLFSGGGLHNPLIMRLIKAELAESYCITPFEQTKIPADAKEAVLFAVLANECIAGEQVRSNSTKYPNVSMGKISFPA